MAIADLTVSAQEWLDADRKDPDGMVARYLRDVATEVENIEQITVRRRTGGTMRSIRTETAYDADGFVEEHVASRNPQSNVLNARAGYVWNRGPAGVRNAHTSGVRRTFPFMREALVTVERVGL